VLTYKIKSIGL